MIRWLNEILASLAGVGVLPAAFVHPFMAYGLAAVLVVAPVFGVLSPLVQVRGLAFFSAALGQSAMVGIAVGVWAGEPIASPWGGLFGVTIVAALWLVFLRRHTRLPRDTLTGVFLSLSLALGVSALVSVTRQFNVHQVEAVLFGSPLTVRDTDLLILVVVGIVVVVVTKVLERTLLLEALDPGLAAAARVRAGIAEYLFVAVLACAVVVALRVVGALLVEALVILPAAAARGFTSSWRGVMLLSVAIAVVGTTAGLVVSAMTPIPAGAAMVLGLGACFLVSLMAGLRR